MLNYDVLDASTYNIHGDNWPTAAPQPYAREASVSSHNIIYLLVINFTSLLVRCLSHYTDAQLTGLHGIQWHGSSTRTSKSDGKLKSTG